jgi:hypothetical protein
VRRALGTAVAALLLASILLAGCGRDTQKSSLPDTFGDGSGGTVPIKPGTTLVLTKPDGTPIGQLNFDGNYFVLRPPGADDGVAVAVLASDANTIKIGLTHISGRPDTPCHFQAAVLARDQGYTIGNYGDRTNSTGLKFNQVNLSSSAIYQALFCVSIRDNAGVMFQAISDSPDKLEWQQVYYIMNTVQSY